MKRVIQLEDVLYQFPYIQHTTSFTTFQHANQLFFDVKTKDWISGPPYTSKSPVYVRKLIHILRQTSLNSENAEIIRRKQQLLRIIQLVAQKAGLIYTIEQQVIAELKPFFENSQIHDNFVSTRGKEIPNPYLLIVYFSLCGILSIRNVEEILRLCIKLGCIQDDHLYYAVPLRAEVQMVRLTNRMRKFATVHKCHPTCIMWNTKNIVEHDG